MAGLVPMRTTHTYSRRDVAEAVQREAIRRGCKPQDVVNDILAQVLVDGTIEHLRRDLRHLQDALGVALRAAGGATAGTAPPAAPPPVSPPAGVRITTLAPSPQAGQNMWDV